VAERTALANRTHTELHGLLPGYHSTAPRLTAPTFITAAKDLLEGNTSVRAKLTRRRLARLAELTAEIRRLPARCAPGRWRAPDRPSRTRLRLRAKSAPR
jgi:transposase